MSDGQRRTRRLQLVAMALKLGPVLAAAALLLASCYDRVYGPTLANGFGQDVSVRVEYSDGLHAESIWRKCQATYVGSENAEIVRILVAAPDGRTIEILGLQIEEIIAAYRRGETRQSIWVLSDSGVILVPKKWVCEQADSYERR
jgi:hypothetical protein